MSYDEFSGLLIIVENDSFPYTHTVKLKKEENKSLLSVYNTEQSFLTC